jgi:predicted metal-dependent enzyme (double-stranded beta helix superfamily)
MNDWLVTADGQCEACEIPDNWEWSTKPYRLYRFLSDLEDILQDKSSDRERLAALRPLVRRLLTSSYWLLGEYLEPDPNTGWSVLTLYEEPDFPITVQTVAWLPGRFSPIHNHGAWGIVAVLSGWEKNRFWRRKNDSKFPDAIEQVGEQILEPGEMISFLPDAIHDVEAAGDEPVITFSVYGETNYKQRFEFDLMNHTAKNF